MPRPIRSEDPSRSPVAEKKFDELRHLLVWLYGSKEEETPPVIRSQNPDLNILRGVLGSKAATRELEERSDLDAAIVTATPKDIRFSKYLIDANGELAKAQQTLDGFDPVTQSELHEIAKSAQRRANIIKATLDSAMVELEGKV